MSFLAVRNLWKEYGDHVVLERVGLSVEKGEFVAIVGASGCGKTTFLKLLLSEEQPTRGEISLQGTRLAPEPGSDRGVVFQRYSVFPHLTVLQNVMIGLEFDGAPVMGRLFGARRRACADASREMLATVGLSEATGLYPDELSGGMQQRLALAQALVQSPRILLLDEPFGALDPGIRLDMHELVTGLHESLGLTVFMVTHDISEGFKLGTRLLVFDKIRQDPHSPQSFGASITFDLPTAQERSSGEVHEIEAAVHGSETR
ncbi:MAG: ABC transporter ATP-binding protein [Proteobacteria bacterium]|nr:ABC transporter ATP-binding protein [Pseudomonadota bacterium]